MLKNTTAIAVSQIRQLFFSKLKFIVWAAILLFGLMRAFTYGNEFWNLQRDEHSASQWLSEGFLNEMIGLVLLFIAFAVGDICAGDFQDRTLYYELTTGKKRSEVYWGRVMPAIIFTLIGSMLLFIAMPAVITAKHGWGTYFSVSDFMIRYVLLIAPLLRIICTMIFISFILKRPFFVALVGFGEYVWSSFINHDSDVLGLASVMKILNSCDRWQVYGLDTDMHTIMDVTLKVPEMAFSVIISLAVSALMLFLGYVYFHTDDLN